MSLRVRLRLSARFSERAADFAHFGVLFSGRAFSHRKRVVLLRLRILCAKNAW